MGMKKKRKKRKERSRLETSDATDRVTFNFTEMRNAERLLELYGEELRYVGPWEMWLTWDKKRWKLDEDGGSMRYAKENAQVMAAEAEAAIKRSQRLHDEEVEADAEEIESEEKKRGRPRKPKATDETANALKSSIAYKRWCEQSQGHRNLQNTLSLAACDKSVAITHESLDADHFLFNVENGTLNLKTGKLQPQARGDLITKLAPIKFDPKAKCPRWEKFVREAMGGDEELVSYNQRFVGYSLTGSTQEQALVFFWGSGNNGKSTFLTTLYKMFGDYALRAARGLLFRTKHGGERHPTMLVSLHGKRFVTCSEIDENQELDEGLTKDLTGGDPINARRMREDEWVFLPTHKLFLAGNHKPRITGTDRGIWRRNNLVPWTVTIADKDVNKKLGDELLEEASGILNWCLAGCLEWQERGLDPPKAIVDATQEYRKEQDVLGQFFDERLVFEENALAARSDLRKLYEDWCEEFGYLPVGARKFAQALRERTVVDGYVWDPKKAQSVDGWRGVRIATRADRAKKELERRGKQMSKKERIAFKTMVKKANKGAVKLRVVRSDDSKSRDTP
jgi:putative DNA primase/helicase